MVERSPEVTSLTPEGKLVIPKELLVETPQEIYSRAQKENPVIQGRYQHEDDLVLTAMRIGRQTYGVLWGVMALVTPNIFPAKKARPTPVKLL